MPEIKWIKITTDMFDDEKIKLIEAMPDADTLLIIWVKLLCQAGKTNADGYIFLADKLPYNDEMLATIFDRPVSTIRLALSTFANLRMIEVTNNGVIFLPNWDKHQNIEGLERIRESTRLRVQRYREKHKQLTTGNTNVTNSNATSNDLDKIRIDKIRIDIYTIIYNYWNSLKIITHKNLTDDIKKKIDKVLKSYSDKDLMLAIKNYAEIVNSKEYYFNHKWTLAEFISRNNGNNIERFLDLEIAKQNYKGDRNEKNKQKRLPKSGEYPEPKEF